MKPRQRNYNNIHFLPADRFTCNFGGPRQSTLDLARRIVRKHQHDEENET